MHFAPFFIAFTPFIFIIFCVTIRKNLHGAALKEEQNMLNVTDYFEKNKKADVSDILQRIINENPNRTLFFPDGDI